MSWLFQSAQGDGAALQPRHEVMGVSLSATGTDGPAVAPRGVWGKARDAASDLAASAATGFRRVRENRHGRAGAQVFAARVLGAGLAYVAQVLAARYLGQEAFGIYGLALIWLTLLGHFAVGGTNQALCRYVAQALATGDHATVRGFLRFGVAFAILAGISIGSIGIAVLVLVPGLGNGIYMLPLTMAFLGVPLLAVQDNLEALARSLGRPLLGIGPAYLVRHGVSILAFAGLALSPLTPSPALALVGALGSLMVGIAVQILLLRRAVRDTVPAGEPRYAVRLWLRTALPIALVDASELMLLNADILAVALFLPPETVALYFAVTRITQMLEFVRYSASAATAPRFAALAATRATGELHRLIALVTLATSALILAGAIALSLAAPYLLSLFGSDFSSAAWLVPILASGMVVACLSGPGEDVLTMLGEERACAFSYVAALLLSISLLFWLVPALGLTGAAVASASAMACRSLMLALYAYTRLGIILPLGLSGRQVHAG